MCPLQIINDIESLSLTLHKLETDRPNKKNLPLENIFLHLYTGFGVKIQNTNGRKSSLNFFDMCKIDT